MTDVVHLESWWQAALPTMTGPVANKLLSNGQLKLMLVSGPNARKDYHLNEGAEFFFMLKGDMRLDVMERGVQRGIVIPEGHVFMLPGRVPHSPQRFADTIGLVLERERLAHEMDGLRWYVEGSDAILFEDWFHCTDLGTQLKPVIEAFNASEAARTGVPAKEYSAQPWQPDAETVLADPIPLREWVAARGAGANGPIYQSDSEFTVNVLTGPEDCEYRNPGETWIFQLSGSATLTTNDDGATHALAEGETKLLLPNVPHTIARAAEGDNTTLVFTNATVASSSSADGDGAAAGAGAEAEARPSPRKRKEVPEGAETGRS